MVGYACESKEQQPALAVWKCSDLEHSELDGDREVRCLRLEIRTLGVRVRSPTGTSLLKLIYGWGYHYIASFRAYELQNLSRTIYESNLAMPPRYWGGSSLKRAGASNMVRGGAFGNSNESGLQRR